MQLLDHQLLDEFEQRLRSQGVPAIESARPGLDAATIDELVAPLGISLPVEARRWWGWHDGVAPDVGAARREIGPGRKWMPLDEAVRECGRIRQMVREAHDPRDQRPIESVWSPSWLPFVYADGLYVVDTGVADDSPCPVRVHWFYEPEAPADLSSIGDLICLWIEAMDRGAWRYDRRADHWTVNHDVLDLLPAAKRGAV